MVSFMGHTIPLEEEFGVGFISTLPCAGNRSNAMRTLWQPHFIEVPVFSQIREVLRRLLSESVDSQLPSAQQSTCQNGIFENGIFESGIL